MSIHYGREKLQLALMELVGPGDIHARLSAALGQHVFHIDPDADLPPRFHEAVTDLKNDLQAYNEGSEGAGTREIIQTLSEHDAEQFARRVVHLYEVLI